MFPAYYSGFADEASHNLDTQIRVTRDLGWSNIEMRMVEVPGFNSANLTDIPDAAFDVVVERLAEAGVRVNSLGSAICRANDPRTPFDYCRDAALRGAARAKRLGAEFVRVMSYGLGDRSDLMEEERFRRLREIVRIFADSGATVVHENCHNYGAMSASHSLRLVENVPGLKLAFDMGNCAGFPDYSKPEPHPVQNAFEFYRGVREHIAYVHIKEQARNPETGKWGHVYPGEGECFVREIITDLFETGYCGALSIEPHLGAAIQDPNLSEAENKIETYKEYGRRLMRLVESITGENSRTVPQVTSGVMIKVP